MKWFHKLIATSLGVGYSPIAPGTCGAIIGAIFYYLAFYLAENSSFEFSQIHLLAAIIVFTGLGILSTKELESEWGHDPSKVVMDETVGLWITMLFIPFHWKYLLAGLILFRIFDIRKPLGIKKIEKFPHGFGVMGDDILAGIYSCIILHALVYFQIF